MKFLSKALKNLFIFVLFITSVQGQNNVTLRRTFIDSLRNAVSISGNFIVDKAHKKPNAPANDGDMHVAGRNKQVGLPIVAEIMNAADYSSAVDLIHSVEGTSTALNMTGVWRFWFEHPSKEQFQEGNLKKFTTTNPAHSFEIHPILKIDDIDLNESLTLIDGFTPYPAETSFPYYSKTKCVITIDDDYININTKKNQYNYTHFVIKISGKKDEVNDGIFVHADVYNTRNKKVAENIRMVFPKNTEAEKKLKTMGEGDKMHLLGIPRINLDEVSNLIKADPDKKEIKINLPFEMIIVGVY